MSPFIDAEIFLIQTIFYLCSFVFLFRLILQFFRADYFNPIVQFFIKLTQMLVKPIRKILPIVVGIDLALLLWAFVFEIVKILLVILIEDYNFNIGGIMLWAVGDLLNIIVNIFFFGVLLVAILSWIKQASYNPITPVLKCFTTPLLRRVRKIIPLIAGFDISPIVILILLKLIAIAFIDPITDVGINMVIHGD